MIKPFLLVGNRVPYEYFLTKGTGESDAGSEGLKYETGSYDEALTQAGIENCNIVEYTSVIPTIAKKISKEEGLKRLQWGEVLETIKAQTNGSKGSFISSAIMTTYVYDKNKQWLGGFAVEYSNTAAAEVSDTLEKKNIEASLSKSIKELIERRSLGTIKGSLKLYEDNVTSKGIIVHPGKDFVFNTLLVKKEHGTVFSAICFVSYQVPQLDKTPSKKIMDVSDLIGKPANKKKTAKKKTATNKKKTANNKKKTANKKKPATNNKKTANKKKPATNKKKTATNKKKTANKKKPANNKKTANKKKTATNKKKTATNKKKPANKKKTATNKKTKTKKNKQ